MDKPCIGIFGDFQIGKSTLVNCLLDDKVAITGSGAATTKKLIRYKYDEIKSVNCIHKNLQTTHPIPFQDFVVGSNLPEIPMDNIEVGLWKPLLQQSDILDTPGFNADNIDNKVAIQGFEDIHFAIIVVENKGLGELQKNIIKLISEKDIPFCVIVNCKGNDKKRWNPLSSVNKNICDNIVAKLREIDAKPHTIDGKYVWPVNLAWFWYATQPYLKGNVDEEDLELFEDVKWYIENYTSVYTSQNAEIAKMSNFIPFRNAVYKIALHNYYYTSLDGVEALNCIREYDDHIRRNDNKMGLVMAEKACYYAPFYVDALFKRVYINYEFARYKDGIHSGLRILNIDSRHIKTLLYLGKCYFELKDYGNAIKYMGFLVDIVKENWKVEWGENLDVNYELYNAYIVKLRSEAILGYKYEFVKTLKDMLNGKSFNALTRERQLVISLLYILISYKDKNYTGIEPFILKLKNTLNYVEVIDIGKTNHIKLTSQNLDMLLDFNDLLNLEACIFYINNRLFDYIQFILYEICLGINNKGIPETAKQYAEYLTEPLSSLIWEECPAIIPYIIYYYGKDSDIKYIERYACEYYLETKEVSDHFIITSCSGITTKNREILKAYLTPKCRIQVNLFMAMNSVYIKNVGARPLSNITMTLEYLEDDVFEKSVKLGYAGTLLRDESHSWSNVFKDKGMKILGGKKVSNVKVICINQNQCGQMKYDISTL